MPRFVSPNISIIVPGPPICSGRKLMSANVAKTKEEYYNIVRLMTRISMSENHWAIIEKPIYLIFTFYLGIHNKAIPKEDVKDMYDGKIIPYRAPYLNKIVQTYMKLLKGLLFKKDSQIVSLFAIKKFSKRERVEILVGVPESIKGLEHDVRNC